MRHLILLLVYIILTVGNVRNMLTLYILQLQHFSEYSISGLVYQLRTQIGTILGGKDLLCFLVTYMSVKLEIT